MIFFSDELPNYFSAESEIEWKLGAGCAGSFKSCGETVQVVFLLVDVSRTSQRLDEVSRFQGHYLVLNVCKRLIEKNFTQSVF